MADVLAGPAAEPPAGAVATAVGHSVPGVEPAVAAGFAAADGAERHGANLTLTISVVNSNANCAALVERLYSDAPGDDVVGG